jgi:hypothetical protein
VVQPHRYTRLRDLMTEFSSLLQRRRHGDRRRRLYGRRAADRGRRPRRLVEGLKKFGHRRALPLESPAALPALIAEEAKSGDLVVLLGAGDITSVVLRPAGLSSKPWLRKDAGQRELAKTQLPSVRGKLLIDDEPWRRSPGSGSAVRPTWCSCRPTSRTCPTS